MVCLVYTHKKKYLELWAFKGNKLKLMLSHFEVCAAKKLYNSIDISLLHEQTTNQGWRPLICLQTPHVYVYEWLASMVNF